MHILWLFVDGKNWAFMKQKILIKFCNDKIGNIFSFLI